MRSWRRCRCTRRWRGRRTPKCLRRPPLEKRHRSVVVAAVGLFHGHGHELRGRRSGSTRNHCVHKAAHSRISPTHDCRRRRLETAQQAGHKSNRQRAYSLQNLREHTEKTEKQRKQLAKKQTSRKRTQKIVVRGRIRTYKTSSHGVRRFASKASPTHACRRLLVLFISASPCADKNVRACGAQSSPVQIKKNRGALCLRYPLLVVFCA